MELRSCSLFRRRLVIRWTVATCAAFLAFAGPGGADTAMLQLVQGPGTGKGFGTSLARVGDLDGDGVEDIAVGVPFYGDPAGVVTVHSGADGAALAMFGGESVNDGFGMAIAVVGDVDGRGINDILVGAPLGQGAAPESSHPTYAKVFAGEDGAVLFDSGDMSSNSRYGAAVASLGDVSGDSVPDFAVGQPERRGFTSSPPGKVLVYSGADGSLLTELSGEENGDGFGTTIAAVGDVDGDGVIDFVVGCPGASRGGRLEAGKLVLFSGAAFDEVRVWRGENTGEGLGGSIAVLADQGSRSFLIAARSVGAPEGRDAVVLFDAISGRRRRTLKAGERVGFGVALAAVDDRDGDGLPELAVASVTVGDLAALDRSALIEVFSPASGSRLFAFRGTAGDATDLALAGCGDLDQDGVGELAVGMPARNAVTIFRPGDTSTPGSVLVALQRTPGSPDSDARGLVEFGPLVASHPLTVTVHRLDQASFFPPHVFLETAPGSREYTELGFMSATTSLPRDWHFDVGTDAWSPPVSQLFATLPDFAGCRVEIRDPFGAPLLQAVVPAPDGQDHRGRTSLVAGDLGSNPKAKGTIRIWSSVRRGSVKLRLKARRLPRGVEYAVWVEDQVGIGTFSASGVLSEGGRMFMDSTRGDPFPGAVPDGASLAGRTIEVRDGSTVLLLGTLP